MSKYSGVFVGIQSYQQGMKLQVHCLLEICSVNYTGFNFVKIIALFLLLERF